MTSIKHDGEARTYVSGHRGFYSYCKSFAHPKNSLSDITAVLDALGSYKQFTEVVRKHMIYTYHGGLADKRGKLCSGFLGKDHLKGKVVPVVSHHLVTQSLVCAVVIRICSLSQKTRIMLQVVPSYL